MPVFKGGECTKPRKLFFACRTQFRAKFFRFMDVKIKTWPSPAWGCLVWMVAAIVAGSAAAGADRVVSDISAEFNVPQTFHVDGDRWTHEDAHGRFQGILLKPQGQGPFPAVIVSHGLGGSAGSFGLTKAREFVQWGMVAIAPDYTHSAAELQGRRGPGHPAAKGFGASAENLRRARICVALLRRMPEVAASRIFAYGHSMGGFVTIALAAHEPLAAAAITGSGIAPRTGFPAPDPETASRIRVPFLIIHGARDTTVRPEQSEALAQLLAQHKVPCRRIVIPDAGHDVDRTHATEVLAAIREWFASHDPATVTNQPSPSTPRGQINQTR